MTIANEITALLTAPAMLLVARGFWPHVTFRGETAGHAMRVAGAITWIALFFRMVWWDLARPLLGSAGWMEVAAYPPGGELTNAAFNLVALAASYFALVALLRSIPEPHRSEFNIFTATGYPPRGRKFEDLPDD